MVKVQNLLENSDFGQKILHRHRHGDEKKRLAVSKLRTLQVSILLHYLLFKETSLEAGKLDLLTNYTHSHNSKPIATAPSI